MDEIMFRVYISCLYTFQGQSRYPQLLQLKLQCHNFNAKLYRKLLQLIKISSLLHRSACTFYFGWNSFFHPRFLLVCAEYFSTFKRMRKSTSEIAGQNCGHHEPPNCVNACLNDQLENKDHSTNSFNEKFEIPVTLTSYSQKINTTQYTTKIRGKINVCKYSIFQWRTVVCDYKQYCCCCCCVQFVYLIHIIRCDIANQHGRI